MKITVRPALMYNLQCAAYNGSQVASVILHELRRSRTEKVLKNSANFFDITTTQDGTIFIRYTSLSKTCEQAAKRLKEDPDRIWKLSDSNHASPTAFAKMFTRASFFEESDFKIFTDMLQFGSKVNVGIFSDYFDFYRAYNGDNYQSRRCSRGLDTLNNSCMRYEMQADVAATFYTEACHNKIIIATNDRGEVIGRAIVWPDAEFTESGEDVPVSFVDRVYHTDEVVKDIILNYAKEHDITLRKNQQSYRDPDSFVVLNSVGPLTAGELVSGVLRSPVYFSPKLSGAPYVDTMYVASSDSGINTAGISGLCFINSDCRFGTKLAEFRGTSGVSSWSHTICAHCGRGMSSEGGRVFCPDCLQEDTSLFGTMIGGESVRLPGLGAVPRLACTENGKSLNSHAEKYLFLQLTKQHKKQK